MCLQDGVFCFIFKTLTAGPEETYCQLKRFLKAVFSVYFFICISLVAKQSEFWAALL